MHQLDKKHKNFLKYGGIDGGDHNAKIWFVGIEWSAKKDMDKWLANHQEKTSFQELIPDITLSEEINEWLDKGCCLEHRMGLIIGEIENIKADSPIELTQKLIEKGKFFQANSGYAKLNLYPLPFSGFYEHKNIEKLYPNLGFTSYSDYCQWCLKNRFSVFHDLIKNKKNKPQIIICFGKTNNEDFKAAFQVGKKISKHLLSNNNIEIELRQLNNSHNYYIIYLPFPKKENENLLIEAGKQIKKFLSQ